MIPGSQSENIGKTGHIQDLHDIIADAGYLKIIFILQRSPAEET